MRWRNRACGALTITRFSVGDARLGRVDRHRLPSGAAWPATAQPHGIGRRSRGSSCAMSASPTSAITCGAPPAAAQVPDARQRTAGAGRRPPRPTLTGGATKRSDISATSITAPDPSRRTARARRATRRSLRHRGDKGDWMARFCSECCASDDRRPEILWLTDPDHTLHGARRPARRISRRAAAPMRLHRRRDKSPGSLRVKAKSARGGLRPWPERSARSTIVDDCGSPGEGLAREVAARGPCGRARTAALLYARLTQRAPLLLASSTGCGPSRGV